MHIRKLLTLLLSVLTLTAPAQTDRHSYGGIIDISLTPGSPRKQNGCFTDMGAWFGFTLPSEQKTVSGICGPFSIYQRNWYARSLVTVEGAKTVAKEYIPGEISIEQTLKGNEIVQRLQFVDSNTALLTIDNPSGMPLTFIADSISNDMSLTLKSNALVINNKGEEAIMLTFTEGMSTTIDGHNYRSVSGKGDKRIVIGISMAVQETDLAVQKVKVASMLANPQPSLNANEERWNGYLRKVIRQDMPHEYNRVAVKSIVTLMSNWRSRRGEVRHDGIVPSHAVNYFIGFWAWDCWRFSAAMASFFPELAKDNIRVMFDYQQPDGMVIDCIYPDASENNARDSKPPLASWAVDRVFECTKDTAFVREMYPKLLKYYKWWYRERDHDHNGICEFGSVDGTLEAAAWESGMDNAIRFDHAKMLRNDSAAYSIDQESVDLNCYLALEYTLMKKFAGIIGERLNLPDRRKMIADYFFDSKEGFFFDRRLDASRSYVKQPGCEGYIPFWTGIATKSQFKAARKLLDDEKKFSTFIPFPTIAADNPKYDKNGYWRGPIWLDQTYYGINSYRRYGEAKKADMYTDKVFRNIKKLTSDAPIYENYDTFTGSPLQSSHFSWSAAHLLMLYEEYGKRYDNLR